MTSDTTLTPFHIDIPEADLDDLRRRLDHTRWPSVAPGRDDLTGGARGIAPALLSELAARWRDGFDWRAIEQQLNRFAQFTTVVDGQTFHVVHVRSANPAATPLLLHHGWPGSFVEYQRLIPLLAEEFHVVVPAPPGFGFSTPLSAAGWHLGRTTEAYAEIMSRLGYERFAAHGSDLGTGIMGRLAATHPERVIGTHYAAERRILGLVGSLFPVPEGLSADEVAELDAIRAEGAADLGYLTLQNHRPDTIGPALTDSPVAQLAWMAEKYAVELIDRDQLLANVSLYWFTRSGESSAQFYYESEHAALDVSFAFGVPAGWAVFDAHPLVRRVMDPVGAVAHWSEFAVGGHFPAMEEPELLAADIVAFFRSLR